MGTYQKILFPVDLSESSPRIAGDVAMMADTFQAELHLLFVARNVEYFRGIHVPFSIIQDFQKALLAGAAMEMERFKEKYFGHVRVRVQPVVTSGDISEEILKYAENEKFDLMIMGTHGRKGMDKILFGSVAERVSRNSPCPILLINPYKQKKRDDAPR